jgi:hypothetical protein
MSRCYRELGDNLMSSLNQLAANRLNATKSTGPSEANFPVTSQNAFKTGLYAKSLLVRGEKQEDLDTLTNEYYDRYQPQSPEEREYVDALIRDSWRLRRFDAVEAQLWEFRISNHKYRDDNSPLGQAFLGADQQFARLYRMIAATRRSFKESLHELERLQAARQENRVTQPPKELDPPPAPSPQSPVPTEIGFVPSTPTALLRPAAQQSARSREAAQTPASSPQSPVPGREAAIPPHGKMN